MIPTSIEHGVQSVGDKDQYGVHDTLREGIKSVSKDVTSDKQLQTRIANVSYNIII